MKKRGSILFTALAIAAVMMLWTIAAVQQANFQTRSIRHSYRKSELYYLCKQATSRALARLNRNPSWLSTYNQPGSADTSTPDTRCWAEPVSGKPGRYNLRCTAVVGESQDSMTVPVVADDDSSTHIYSVTSSIGGADLVAWTSRTKDGWSSLPPIPGSSKIVSVVSTNDGDVYAIGKTVAGNTLWRYRQGRNWVQLPDPPGNTQVLSLAANGGEQLICLGSDNSLLLFPLKVNAMQWQSVAAPTGLTLKEVGCSSSFTNKTYATAQAAGGPVLLNYDQSSDAWSTYPSPPAVRVNADTGEASSSADSVSDYSGGMAVNGAGKIFVASNPGDSPSVIYSFQPDSSGSATGNWTYLPPLHDMIWDGSTARTAPTFATSLKHLRIDDRGGLWAQIDNPDGRNFATIHVILP